MSNNEKDLFDDDLFGDASDQVKKTSEPEKEQTKDISSAPVNASPVSQVPVIENPDKSESATKEIAEKPSRVYSEGSNDIPTLIGKREEYPESYLEVVDSVIRVYKQLPYLNYAEIQKELSNLSVASSPTPTPQLLNLELQRIQGAKDRLSEIFNDVQRSYGIKKRAVDILRDGWGKYTSEKNAEGRRGDAAIRISNFEMDLAQTEAQFKVCLHILKNLDDQHESLSRRITTIQIQLKIFDMGRGSLPDFDFDKGTMLNASDDEVWSSGKKKDFDKDKPIEAEEQGF